MKKRLLAIILIITMITPLAVGCGNTTEAKSKVVIEGVLNDENLSLTGEGVAMKLDSVNLTGETKAIISRVSNAPPLDESGDIQLDVYEFELEGIEQFDGVMELVIPLDMAVGEQPGAAWLNEETGVWEPVSFMYDEAAKSVVIATDHLSKYGVFSVSNEGMRRARVEFLGLWGTGQDEDYLAAINEYASGGAPSTACLDIGTSAVGDALQLGGDFLGNIGQSAGYLAYGDDVLSTIGDHLGKLGLLVSVVQVSSNIYNGKIHSAVVGSMKTALTYVLNKAASKLSSAVMSASMASVAIVDYSINKFGTEALEGRASIYRDAYGVYYQKGNDGFRSSAYWFTALYPLFTAPNITEEQLKSEVDKIVTEHCNEFWTGANKLGIDYYISEAREKFKWTAGEAGLNDEIRTGISEERRSILYGQILPGVFQQIALKINLENERKLREEYAALSNYLNTVITFSVTDSKKMYAKHLVRFAPLNDRAEIDNWTGKFNNDGSLSTSFTLYGHIYSGAPSSIEIFKPDADIEKDEPVRVIDFKVTPPAIEIVIGEEVSGLKYTGGDKSKILQYGLDTALKQADTITIGKDGNFTIEVDYATASNRSGNTSNTSEVQGFTMEGKIDPGTMKGNATFAATMVFTKKELSPMDAMEGETKEYVTTTRYEDAVSGNVTITGSADSATFNVTMQGGRSGYTKLQYHSIDPSGKEYWGEKPTITDKSGDVNGSGAYKFSVKK